MTKKKAKRGPRIGSSAIAKRADLLLSDKIADGDDDDLLTTQEVADWFRCSPQWLEGKRSSKKPGKVRGPPYVRPSPRMIRYRRKDCRDYLLKRLHELTAEYSGRRVKR